MRKALALLAAAAGAVFAGPAAAQVQPAPLGEIYESYNDCFAVVTPTGFRPDALEGRGWRLAEVERDATSGAESVAIYGHASRRPMLLLNSAGSLCIVLARLENAGGFEEFKQAWGGQLPAPDAEGVTYFRAEGRTVRLARTGTAEAPSISLAVTASTEN